MSWKALLLLLLIIITLVMMTITLAAARTVLTAPTHDVASCCRAGPDSPILCNITQQMMRIAAPATGMASRGEPRIVSMEYVVTAVESMQLCSL